MVTYFTDVSCFAILNDVDANEHSVSLDGPRDVDLLVLAPREGAPSSIDAMSPVFPNASVAGDKLVFVGCGIHEWRCC